MKKYIMIVIMALCTCILTNVEAAMPDGSPCVSDDACLSEKCIKNRCGGSNERGPKADGDVCTQDRECNSFICGGEQRTVDCRKATCFCMKNPDFDKTIDGEPCQSAEQCLSGTCNSVGKCGEEQKIRGPKAEGDVCTEDKECDSSNCGGVSRKVDCKKTTCFCMSENQ